MHSGRAGFVSRAVVGDKVFAVRVDSGPRAGLSTLRDSRKDQYFAGVLRNVYIVSIIKC